MANNGPIGGPGTRPGVCFACGVPGHWRRECQATEQDKHKISVNLSCLVDSSPVGRLNAHIEHWVAIGTDDYILSVIREGYKLPFYQLPKSVILKNNNSARMNPDVVEDAILKLINNGCVSETDVVPKVVNPLTVAFNRSGKARLVLDCRHINLHLYKFKFRLEDGSLARNMFVTGGWLVVLRINVDLAIFQPYLDLEAGDNQSLKIQVARPGIEPGSSCSASQELNHSATAAPSCHR